MRWPIDSALAHWRPNKYDCLAQYRFLRISPQSLLGFIMIVFEVVFRIWRVSLNFLAKKIISFENIVLWENARIMLDAFAALKCPKKC